MGQEGFPFDFVPSEGTPMEAVPEDLLAFFASLHSLNQLHEMHHRKVPPKDIAPKFEDLGEVRDHELLRKHSNVSSSRQEKDGKKRDDGNHTYKTLEPEKESKKHLELKDKKNEEIVPLKLDLPLLKVEKEPDGNMSPRRLLTLEDKVEGILRLSDRKDTDSEADESQQGDILSIDDRKEEEDEEKEPEKAVPVDLKNRMALYETSEHGPPIVGAAIIRHDGIDTHVDFAHPKHLREKVTPGNLGKLTVNDCNSWATKELDAVKELESCFHLVPRLALGSMRDTALIDFVYFTLPTPSGNYLYGVSYVARFETEDKIKSLGGDIRYKPSYNRSGFDTVGEKIKVEVSDDMGTSKRITPGISTATPGKHYFISICVISKVPFFCYIGCKLEYIAQTYFHTKCFTDHQLLLSFVEQMNQKERVENWSYESLYFNLEAYFKPLSLCVTYRTLLFLVKCVMSAKKIIVYSACAARTATAVLSILTMIPGASALGFNSKGFGSLWHSWKKFGLPLHLFHSQNVIYPYFTPEMAELLDNVTGYLIGMTDRNLIKIIKNKPDMVLNVESSCIRLFNRRFMEMYYPSLYEMEIFDGFVDDMESSEDEEVIKNMVEAGEAICSSISGYLTKAPSTLISIGGTVKRLVNRRSQSRGTIKCNESALGLLDKYFPGAVPSWLTKNAISKRPTSVNAKGTVMSSSPTRDSPDSSETTTFTVQGMFEKMAKSCNFYKYLHYVEYVHGYKGANDRMREIEYAINNRINPMHNYLLKFLEDAAYVCGERRIMYQLLMDFEFDLTALIDCAQHVVGIVLRRGDVYLRGNLPEEFTEPGFVDTLLNMDLDYDSLNNQVRNAAQPPAVQLGGQCITGPYTLQEKPPSKPQPQAEEKTPGLLKMPKKFNKESITKLGFTLANKGKSMFSSALSTQKTESQKTVEGSRLKKADPRQNKKVDYTDEIDASYDGETSVISDVSSESGREDKVFSRQRRSASKEKEDKKDKAKSTEPGEKDKASNKASKKEASSKKSTGKEEASSKKSTEKEEVSSKKSTEKDKYAPVKKNQKQESKAGTTKGEDKSASSTKTSKESETEKSTSKDKPLAKMDSKDPATDYKGKDKNKAAASKSTDKHEATSSKLTEKEKYSSLTKLKSKDKESSPQKGKTKENFKKIKRTDQDSSSDEESESEDSSSEDEKSEKEGSTTTKTESQKDEKSPPADKIKKESPEPTKSSVKDTAEPAKKGLLNTSELWSRMTSTPNNIFKTSMADMLSPLYMKQETPASNEDKPKAPTPVEQRRPYGIHGNATHAVERIPTSDYGFRKPDDQEVHLEVIGTVATKIMVIQNNHSIEFLERWLTTTCAKKFFEEHNLTAFNEPIYLINSKMAKHKYPNGDVYIGELVHLKREGKGTYISVDGTQYDGYWVGGKRQGEGTLVSTKHNYTYVGEWNDDKREGHGELTTPLFQYVGSFKENQFHGRGKLVQKGGPTYEGDFEKGKYNGRGRLTMVDGTIKIGSFRDNELFGVCSVVRTDGRIYVGKLHGDVIDGKGKLIYNRLVSFEGVWNEGVREGQGVVEIKLKEDGSEGSVSIEGIWHNDSLLMEEVMIKFPNNYKYVGSVDYCSDLSQLMYLSSYDEKLLTQAEEARLSFDNRILPHGRGIIKSPTGSSYNGELSHGMRFGKGDRVFGNAVLYSGEWAFGAVHGEAQVTFPGSSEPVKLHFKYGKLIDNLHGSQLKYIKECLDEVGTASFEREFTTQNLEPFPGLLTAVPI